MTLKNTLGLSFVMLLFGFSFFVYFFKTDWLKAFSPGLYCGKFSGRESYAWGGVDLQNC